MSTSTIPKDKYGKKLLLDSLVEDLRKNIQKSITLSMQIQVLKEIIRLDEVISG